MFFDSGGRYLQSVGRSGTGPEDFFNLYAVFLLPGDSLMIDNINDLKILDGQGNYLRTLSDRGRLRAAMEPRGVLGNGTVIGTSWLGLT